MFRKLLVWVQRNERLLSAVAMVGGAAFDQVFFGRIDVLRTQLVFASYVVICFVSIPLFHALESRAVRPRWRALVPLATQFALGGFWSGFFVFYVRAAALSASWPFIVIILAALLGNEIFKKYHERLVFTSVLFFFALYATAIFELPIYLHTVSEAVFLESGLVAIVLFGLFTIPLRLFGRARFLEDVWRIRAGALAVLVVINLCYFTGVIPPLPLAARAAGVYDSVVRVPGGYQVALELQPWLVQAGLIAPTFHVETGQSLSTYASIFAPTALTATVYDRWQWRDPTTGAWTTRLVISYPITGGRDGGYGGYSTALMNEAGKWRVDVDTAEGLVIARLPFTVVFASTTPALSTTTVE